MPDKLILFAYQSWANLDDAVAGLDSTEANVRHDGASRISWTVGHVTNMIDSWVNVRFQRLPPHPLIGDAMFRSGASGEAPDWSVVIRGTTEVRQAAVALLDAEPGPDLDQLIPYEGSIPFLRTTGLSLRYTLMRIAAHHFMHAGEIETIRARLGHTLPDASPNWGVQLI